MTDYFSENKIYNAKSHFPKTNYATYVFLTKTTRRNFLTTVKSKVRFAILIVFTGLNFGKTDQEVVAKLAEVDMIIADLDRANSRIAALEHRNVGSTSISSSLL